MQIETTLCKIFMDCLLIVVPSLKHVSKCFRKDTPSCKLLYVTPERVAGNMTFQETLKCLHRKVNSYYGMDITSKFVALHFQLSTLEVFH